MSLNNTNNTAMDEDIYRNLYSNLCNDVAGNIATIDKSTQDDIKLNAELKDINPNIAEEQQIDEIAHHLALHHRDNNLLNDDVRKAFLAPVIKSDTRRRFSDIGLDDTSFMFSELLSTTVTLAGTLSNAPIDETKVDLYEPTQEIVKVSSNYGERIHYTFNERKVEKKSNRGRKPKPRDATKERKKQGNGNSFNSQITFLYRTGVPDKKDPMQNKEYKFKIFRNNKLQLPGAHPDMIDHITDAALDIVDMLNDVLHVDAPNDAKAQLVSICPQMKNYKFYIKMNHGDLIDLNLLKLILFYEHIKQSLMMPNNITPEELETHMTFCNCNERACRNCMLLRLIRDKQLHDAIANSHDIGELAYTPSIFSIKYGDEDTKLAIRFSTPIEGKPNKKTKVNIFPGKGVPQSYHRDVPESEWGGKFNILGAFYEDDTRAIYWYLEYLFAKYYNSVIITPGVCDDSDDEFEIYCDE